MNNEMFGSLPIRLIRGHLMFISGCRYASSEARVRFAPSPTGQLHLGGLRTALYNYLFARSNGGKFVLRIEDTDQTRIVPGAVENLHKVLEWAGISVDEGPLHGGDVGPYIQSQRLEFYKDNIQVLLQNGTAYPCFCSAKRLDLLRKSALRQGETPKYDNRCRHLTEEEVQNKMNQNEPYVIRFKLAEFPGTWQDLVYGEISQDIASVEGDPILVKSDGFPTYHFANVVDDHYMNITHVLRGVEWQVSTTKHLLLYAAFGWNPPQFAHLPLILNKDGSKLSKRQNDIHVEHFMANSHHPAAVLNLLTNIGSGFKVRNTAGLNMEQLIQQFDLASMRTNSTRLDLDFLSDLNRKHLKTALNGKQRPAVIEDVKQKVIYTFQTRSDTLVLEDLSTHDDYIGAVLDWASQERICRAQDLLQPEFTFLWCVPSGDTLKAIHLPSGNVEDILSRTVQIVNDTSTWKGDVLKNILKQEAKVAGVKFGLYMNLLRAALSGLKEGPSVVEMMMILGQERTIQRLQRAQKIFSDKTLVT